MLTNEIEIGKIIRDLKKIFLHNKLDRKQMRSKGPNNWKSGSWYKTNKVKVGKHIGRHYYNIIKFEMLMGFCREVSKHKDIAL